MTASQAPLHGTKGDPKAGESRLGSNEIATKAYPGSPPETANFANFGILAHMATPWRQDAGESEGTQLHRADREVLLEGHGGGCFSPALVRPALARPRGQFWTFLSQRQVGLTQPTFSPQLLDNGRAMSPAQRRFRTCHQRSIGSHCRSTLEPIKSLKLARGPSRSSLGRVLGSIVGRFVGCV